MQKQTKFHLKVDIYLIEINYGMPMGGTPPPPPSPGQGGARGVLFFMIKQKIIRDQMRFSNLRNNMMISEL